MINIEMYGAGYSNKGAQLMLLTVLTRIRQAEINARCAQDPGPVQPYEERAKYALYQIFPPYSWQRRLPFLQVVGRTLPPRLRESYGIVRRDQCDALIDISGYAYGDGWGWAASGHSAERANAYKRRNKPVILLPQMLGPFQKPRAAEMFRRLLDNATLIYARDQVSYEYACSVGGQVDKIRIAPDITIFIHPDGHQLCDGEVHAPEFLSFADRTYACLVPNCRMLDQGKEQWGETYIQRLVEAGQQLIRQGLKVKVVVHDNSPEDLYISQEVVDQLPPLESSLVVEPDPLQLKSLLGKSLLIVASRFHSIVSALSSGTPALALGWSHKYQMLMEDFGVPDLTYRATDSKEQLQEFIDDLTNPTHWKQRHKTLLDSRRRMSDDNQKMWDDVLRIVQGQTL